MITYGGVDGEIAGVWRSGRSCRILLGTWLSMEALMGLGGVYAGSFMIPSCARTLWVAQAWGVGLLGLVACEKPFKYILLFTKRRNAQLMTGDWEYGSNIDDHGRDWHRRTDAASRRHIPKHHFWHLPRRIEYPVEDPGVMVLGWGQPWGRAVE